MRNGPEVKCNANCLECTLERCWLDRTWEDDFSMLDSDDYRAEDIEDALDDRTLKEKRKAVYWSAYQQAHKDEIADYQRAYRAAHRADIAAKKKAWRSENRDYISVTDREYYVLHRAEKLAKARAYREANRETINRSRREARARKKAEALACHMANMRSKNMRRCAPGLEASVCM